MFVCLAVFTCALSSLSVPVTDAFTAGNINIYTKTYRKLTLFSTDAPSDIEKLLEKARQLRAEAEAQEEKIHTSLLSKKEQRDAETDKLISGIFDQNSRSLDEVVNYLRTKRFSSDKLFNIVDRLHEREITAKGIEHVTKSRHGGHSSFKQVKEERDDAELARVSGMIEQLINAVKVLDEEFLEDKSAKGEKYNTHFESEHWNAGNCAKMLDDKVREMRREHDEQFKKRQKEFYDAQRRKDLP
mmetsp:Transcript_28128/g.41543  ORF Transcript_28128/g.41543 Transcript_28128/m.41543 type:complete len:243 (-) Transcript_28128:135-863(-)